MPLSVPWALLSVPPARRAQHLGRGCAGSPSPLDCNIPPVYPSPGASLLPSPSCWGRGWDAGGYLEEGLLILGREG